MLRRDQSPKPHHLPRIKLDDPPAAPTDQMVVRILARGVLIVDLLVAEVERMGKGDTGGVRDWLSLWDTVMACGDRGYG